MTTLTPGKRYDLSTLTPAGWTPGDGSGHLGYGWRAYFQTGIIPDQGVYLGPDVHGIEPLFTEDIPCS